MGVGGTGVEVAVGGMGVAVGGTGVEVGGMGVKVAVGGTDVDVGAAWGVAHAAKTSTTKTHPMI